MTRKLGDFSWEQLSIWDFAPDNCVESYIKEGTNVYHYKLVRVSKIISDSRWQVEDVETLEGVPEDILFTRNREVYLKCCGKRSKVIKEIRE